MSREFIRALYIPGGIVVICLFAGIFIDLVLLRYLRKLARKTPWEGDELIIKALARRVPLWGLLIGLAIAIPYAPLSEKVAAGLTSLVKLSIVLSVTWVGASVVADLIHLSSSGPAGPASTTIFKVLARIGVWGIGIAVALHTIGVSIAPVLTALGVGGLAVALAMQDTLSNLFAGIQILLARQLKVGDFIRIDPAGEGIVTDINWRNTSIRALGNNIIVIPNSKIASSILVNFNLPETALSVLVQVGVAYGSELEKVERVTIEVAKDIMQTVTGGVPEHEPFIRYHTFGDSSIQFSVILRGQTFTDQYLIKHEFIKRLQKRYREEGIEIPFPQRVVTMNRIEVGQ